MSKYGNKKCVIDGITFRSLHEGRRYCELKVLLRTGHIADLQLQVKFELIRGVRINGRSIPPIRYFADFVYTMGGKQVVEDAKGDETRVYKMKRHMMLAIHGITIVEV